MTRQQVLIGIAAASILEGAAVAGTCKVQSWAAAGDWRFVDVYDVTKSEIVLRQAINGGDSKDVTVTGDRIRVNHKRSGNRNYAAGPVADCKNGNTVKF